MQSPSWTIGTLIEHERMLTLSAFAGNLRPKHTVEEALALHVRMVEQTITHKPGGRIQVWTRVRGHRPWDDEDRFTRWNTREGTVKPAFNV